MSYNYICIKKEFGTFFLQLLIVIGTKYLLLSTKPLIMIRGIRIDLIIIDEMIVD